MFPVGIRHSLTAWWQAFRAPAQINLALPLLVGLRHGAPERLWSEMPWLVVGTLSALLQAMIVFSNEAADADTDDLAARTPISGGAGVGASQRLTARQLRRGAQIAGGLGLLLSLLTGGASLAALWLCAILLVWAYDGDRLRLSRNPTGALAQALGVGVLTPLIGAVLVAPAGASSILSPAFVLTGVCLGLAGHLLTALPDRITDSRVGKQTLAVALGEGPALGLMLALYSVAAVVLLASQVLVAVLSSLTLVGVCAGRGRWRELDASIWLTMPSALFLWLAWIEG